jgi:GR25 family glycosyltransferase involved in LPS biosynthesis
MGRKNRIKRNKKLKQQQMSVVNEKEIPETPGKYKEMSNEYEEIPETPGKYKEMSNEDEEIPETPGKYKEMSNEDEEIPETPGKYKEMSNEDEETPETPGKYKEMSNEDEEQIEKEWEIVNNIHQVFHSLKLIHIFCVVNKTEEQDRYHKLQDMFKKHELDNYYKCISPTWKNTITQEQIKKYIKSTEYLIKYRQAINLPPKRMNRAELSVILNHRAVLRHISKNYDSGYFLIVESDVQFTENFNMFPEILKQMNENEDKWDLMYIGKMPQSNYYKCTQEIVSNERFKIYTGKEDKTADAIVWKYETIIKFLKYMKNNLDFKVPYDTYLQQFYRSKDINFGWIQPEILFQTTFYGLSKSLVQEDVEICKEVQSYF